MKIRGTRWHLVPRFRRSRSCRIERHPETMKINHEETDSHRSSLFFLRFLRFFVVDFRRSHSRVRKTRPETMKIRGTRWHLVPLFRRSYSGRSERRERNDKKQPLGNILGKLRLAHRTQPVICAIKRNLVSLDEL